MHTHRMVKKLKKPKFPVKQFQLPGGVLSQEERVTVVREAMGKAQGKSRVTGDAAKVMRGETASGSGMVSFVVFKPSRSTAVRGEASSRRASRKPQKSV